MSHDRQHHDDPLFLIAKGSANGTRQRYSRRCWSTRCQWCWLHLAVQQELKASTDWWRIFCSQLSGARWRLFDLWSHNTSDLTISLQRESEFPCVCCQYPFIKLWQKICENNNTGSPTGNTVEPTGRSCVVPVGRSWWFGPVEKRFKVPSHWTSWKNESGRSYPKVSIKFYHFLVAIDSLTSCIVSDSEPPSNQSSIL